MRLRPPTSPLFPYTTLFRSFSTRAAWKPEVASRPISQRRPIGTGVLPKSAERRYQRSEEHTSELQSQSNLVCRLLLEKKKKTRVIAPPPTSIALHTS